MPKANKPPQPHLCRACGADMAGRPRQAFWCALCLQARRDERERNRTNQDYYKEQLIRDRLRREAARRASGVIGKPPAPVRPHTCRRCKATNRDNPRLKFLDYTAGGSIIWLCWKCYDRACEEIAS